MSWQKCLQDKILLLKPFHESSPESAIQEKIYIAQVTILQYYAIMQSVSYMQALSDETRLRCFRLIAAANTPLSSPELVDILHKPLYTISRSMSELNKAGMVREFKQGRIVLHGLNTTPGVQELADWVIHHCHCESNLGNKNLDGSKTPGLDACDYDLERLHWRLNLREKDKVVVTYEKNEATDKQKVLFVCVYNSARSQMAEEYLRRAAGDIYTVESAGLTPGILNPYVVEVLLEDGIDISKKPPVAVKDLYRQGKTYDWVITVCSREAEKNCPVFPGPIRKLNWPFADPATIQGSYGEIKSQIRALADEIKSRIKQFLDETKNIKGVNI